MPSFLLFSAPPYHLTPLSEAICLTPFFCFFFPPSRSPLNFSPELPSLGALRPVMWISISLLLFDLRGLALRFCRGCRVYSPGRPLPLCGACDVVQVLDAPRRGPPLLPAGSRNVHRHSTRLSRHRSIVDALPPFTTCRYRILI